MYIQDLFKVFGRNHHLFMKAQSKLKTSYIEHALSTDHERVYAAKLLNTELISVGSVVKLQFNKYHVRMIYIYTAHFLLVP